MRPPPGNARSEEPELRLRPEKVHDLAAQIVAGFREHSEIHPQATDDALRVVIGSVILDDLREEEEIDAEADALMAEHAKQIDEGDMDAASLRQKFKRQIARERGFTL